MILLRSIFIVFFFLLSMFTNVVADDTFPASDFQPKVLYLDQDVSNQDSQISKSAETVVQSQNADKAAFPAASFEPKLVYRDDSYEHKTDAPNLQQNEQNNSTFNITDDFTESNIQGGVNWKEFSENSNDYYILAALIALFFLVAHWSKNGEWIIAKKILNKLKVRLIS